MTRSTHITIMRVHTHTNRQWLKYVCIKCTATLCGQRYNLMMPASINKSWHIIIMRTHTHIHSHTHTHTNLLMHACIHRITHTHTHKQTTTRLCSYQAPSHVIWSMLVIIWLCSHPYTNLHLTVILYVYIHADKQCLNYAGIKSAQVSSYIIRIHTCRYTMP